MSTIWYEVTATVRPDTVVRWEAYMREKHIRDVLQTGCFSRATLERATSGRFRVIYEAPSREQLDRYLTDHAPRLRNDVHTHFPEGVELVREEWSQVETFRAGTPTPFAGTPVQRKQ
jgi:hypothetical protein